MEGRAAPAQLVHDRLVDLRGDLARALRVDPGHRRVAAHAAGVGTLVAVEDALVVLRGRERHGALAVAERQQRELLALEELLQHHLGLAEALLAEEHVDRLARLALVLGDDHSLARREHVRLQHRGIRRAREVGGGLVAVAEHHVRGGGHAAVAHQLLRVGLRALDPRGGPGRSERADARRAQRVHEAGHERRLGPHHHEVDPARPRRPRPRRRPEGTPRRRGRCRRCRGCTGPRARAGCAGACGRCACSRPPAPTTRTRSLKARR